MLKGFRDIHGVSDAFLLKAFSLLLILTISVSVLLYSPIPLLLPIALLGGLFIINKPTYLYYLFFFLLPFSVEYELPGGFGTDLPSEPLMLILAFVCLLLLLKKTGDKQTAGIVHPIGILIILHFGWIAFTTIYSSNVIFSMKFILAKAWYLLPFYFLPIVMIDNEKQFRALFKFLIGGLMISVLYVMVRHAGLGFSFESINQAVKPIYRNHVNYGILLIICLPYLVYLIGSCKNRMKWILLAALAFLLLAIYLTYTRAAHLSVFIAVGVYFIVRWRLTKAAILVAAAGLIIFSAYLSINNKYLEMAPDYNKAVEHKKFDNLVEATYKMEDISTVERFYRWIAGVNMVAEKPFVGFGPSTFYSEYRPFTVTSYKTYVSDNPEKSGIHNYYLMTAAEQGLPGLIIFLVLSILCILFGEQSYHLLKSEDEKSLVMASTVCFVLILAVLLINDLLEADKVGPFFFLSAAIITIFNMKTKRTVKA